jgi:hypothetical protein
MTEEWGRPAETGGEFVKPAQLAGHLVILFPIGYIPFIQTRFSGQSNKPSDGIVVDVVDLDDKDEYGNPGKLYRHNTFMQAQLIASLKSQIGSKILGTIGQGTARNGMNQPWVVIDMSGDETARQRGSAWIAANPHFRPSSFTPRAPQATEPPPNNQYSNPQGGGGYSEPRREAPRQDNWSHGGGGYDQRPPQREPEYQPPRLEQRPAQQEPRQNPGYAGVEGSAQLSNDEISLLQHHRQLREAAERERQRQASFNEEPPF